MRVSDYLINRLEKLGVTDFFGLPGDYNFNILYAVEDNPNTNWIGCTNELNAGYAADGYARTKGYGALITTYGVGELSAINAIAGAFAENIPVMHIVGVPTTKDIRNNTLIHHNFQLPNYFAFEQAHKEVVETTAYLNFENAKEEIDRTIDVMVRTKRPVYIAIPMDVALHEIDYEYCDTTRTSNKINLKEFTDKASEIINNSKNPIVLFDTLIKRYQAEKEFKNFLNKTNLYSTNLLMGCGILNSDFKNYLGNFLGKYDNKTAELAIEETDCMISIGVIYSDLNSCGFALPHEPNENIAIYGTYGVIDNEIFDNIYMEDVLTLLAEKITERKENKYEFSFGYKPSEIKNKPLSAEYIYPRLQEFFKENDLLFMETGIIPQGFAGCKLPDNVKVNTQTLWGSIGWATPATLGGCIADKNRRAILFTGEGSHQLTATEIGNIMRRNLKPIIIVLNNSGYTIERFLCKDPADAFNEIAEWNYSKLPEVFAGNVWIAQASTDAEFDKVLKLAENQNKMCYIEIFTNKLDLPYITRKTIENIKY